MFLITEAHAQATEAAKAAADAADILFQYKVLGAFCVVLALVAAVLFWCLLGAWEKIQVLAVTAATEVSANKTAMVAVSTALERVQAAQAAAAQALQEQSSETAKEISETRHTVANYQASVAAIVDMLVRQRGRGAA